LGWPGGGAGGGGGTGQNGVWALKVLQAGVDESPPGRSYRAVGARGWLRDGSWRAGSFNLGHRWGST